MKINKTPYFTVILITVFFFPVSLFSQEDLSVDFSFYQHNELVCKIRNLTNHKISILFSRERTPLYFDIVQSDNDTILYQYYELWKDLKRNLIYLDPGKVYAVSYRENPNQQFIKAHISLDYMVRDSAPKVKNYSGTFDLNQIRKEINTLPKLKNAVSSAIFHELNDSMLIYPNRNLIVNKIEKMQRDTLSKYQKEVKCITKEDIDNAIIVNLIKIFPDTASIELKYKVDDDYYLLYIPSQEHLYYWEKSSERFRAADDDHFFSYQLYNEIKELNHLQHKQFFIFSFFPKEHQRLEHIIAYNYHDTGKYFFKDILLNKLFFTFQDIVQYYFYSVPHYTEMYKYRISVDYPSGWNCIY